MEDSLKRLDKLTQEEARMVAAQNLKATHTVDERVKEVAGDVDDMRRLSSNLTSVDYVVLLILSENQLRESTHKWLSPPDPSTNHNIACGTHHKKTATWFFEGRIYQEWKAAGSLLWIHGKRLSIPLSKLTPSDTILSCSWLGQKCNLVRRF
jgi:hypothetical protein